MWDADCHVAVSVFELFEHFVLLLLVCFIFCVLSFDE